MHFLYNARYILNLDDYYGIKALVKIRINYKKK